MPDKYKMQNEKLAKQPFPSVAEKNPTNVLYFKKNQNTSWTFRMTKRILPLPLSPSIIPLPTEHLHPMCQALGTQWWAEAGIALPTWNLQATETWALVSQMITPVKVTDWDKGSEREEYSSKEEYNYIPPYTCYPISKYMLSKIPCGFS